MSIYDYDEEDVRRTLFEEAKEMAKEELKLSLIHIYDYFKTVRSS